MLITHTSVKNLIQKEAVKYGLVCHNEKIHFNFLLLQNYFKSGNQVRQKLYPTFMGEILL